MSRLHSATFNLLSDVQLLDDSAVTLDIDLLKVCEKVSSVTDHLEKSAAAVVVLVVSLEVLGESVDAIGKDRDLNLGRTGVALVGLVLVDDCLLFVFSDHGIFHLSFYFAQAQHTVGEKPLSLLSANRASVITSYYTTNLFSCKELLGNLTNYFLQSTECSVGGRRSLRALPSPNLSYPYLSLPILTYPNLWFHLGSIWVPLGFHFYR